MTSCVGSKGAKSAVLNRDVVSYTNKQIINRWLENHSTHLSSDLHLGLNSSLLRSHWPYSSRSLAPCRHSIPPPERYSTHDIVRRESFSS